MCRWGKAPNTEPMMKNQTEIKRMRRQLLDWYDREGRDLPWRIRPEARDNGVVADPYRVWLSEIMLQQTTTVHAAPYWEKFLQRWPTVSALAGAPLDDVLAMWAGLGYYARARNLHKCALAIRDTHGGKFPESEADLLKLPGIGPYTAATIAAICFYEATNIVDGNVERVIARIFAESEPLPKAKSRLRHLAAPLADPQRPGDYGQAIMDLGATVCTPRSPACTDCPWSFACRAFKDGDPEAYPRKVKKKRPVKYGVAFALISDDHILMRKRPEKGLLGGMLELPGSDWDLERPGMPLAFAPAVKNWQKCAGDVVHVFTHFELRLDVYRAEHPRDDISGVWAPLHKLEKFAVPTLFKKAIAVALET